MISRVAVCVVVLWSICAPLSAQTNLLPNGGFETDANGDGLAEPWQFAGDSGVKVSYRLEPGRHGLCQRIDCSSFEQKGPASHVMLCQVGTVTLKKGQWYTLSLAAKSAGLRAGSVQVATSDMRNWTNCGLNNSFVPHRDWREFTFTFQANKDIREGLRLQIWYTSTGTLWLDDASLVESKPVVRQHTEEVLPGSGRNLVPNGSFECGPAGWGSITDVPGWGGNMSRLYGTVDTSVAKFGRSSMRIDMDPAKLPTYFFDYYNLSQQPVQTPVLANRGWISVTPGTEYTLSAFVRTDIADAPVEMRVYQADAGMKMQKFTAGMDWQRIQMTFRAQRPQLFVGVGPTLAGAPKTPYRFWIDAVQLEAGAQPTDYAARSGVECGFVWAQSGHLFAAGKPATTQLWFANSGTAVRRVPCNLVFTDHFGSVSRRPLTVEVPAGGAVAESVSLPTDRRGVYRLQVESKEALPPTNEAERFGVINPCTETDGLFGMNHAYPWDFLNRLSKEFGLTWYRDWSLKWQTVQPQPGPFDFSATDPQIDRVLKDDLHVIGLLPFPSSEWESTAPPRKEGARTDNTDRVSWLPKDLDAFAAYVRATVAHYRGRIRVWEIMNEPVYTEYAVPARDGFKVADYVKLLEVGYKAVKAANPDTLVIGGIAGHASTYTKEFIAAGGLQWVDALNLHTYPGRTMPESYVDSLRQLQAGMQADGRVKPIWFTEGTYYGDDDPPYQPFNEWLQLVDSELDACALQVRFDAIYMTYGVRKFISHSGTPGQLNNVTPSSVFFEWDGAPRKMVASQTVLARLFGLDVQPLGRLTDDGSDLWAYGFHSHGKTVIVVWVTPDDNEMEIKRPQGAQVLDIVGNPISGATLKVTSIPIYFLLDGTVDSGKLKTLIAATQQK